MPSAQNEAYRVFGLPGSWTMSVAPWSSSVTFLMFFQVFPPFFDSQRPYFDTSIGSCGGCRHGRG